MVESLTVLVYDPKPLVRSTLSSRNYSKVEPVAVELLDWINEIVSSANDCDEALAELLLLEEKIDFNKIGGLLVNGINFSQRVQTDAVSYLSKTNSGSDNKRALLERVYKKVDLLKVADGELAEKDRLKLSAELMGLWGSELEAALSALVENSVYNHEYGREETLKPEVIRCLYKKFRRVRDPYLF